MMKKIIVALVLILASGINATAADTPVSSNSRGILKIENYLGNYENIHPKVLYFDNGWNGYEFWMAYTPYPLGSTDAENPCIAVSHDGLNWEVPDGMVNPLAFAPEEGYNSDTHLVYNPETDLLECWWREYDIPNNYDAICRRVSENGKDWGEKEVILPYDKNQHARFSPVVWIADAQYRLLYSDGSRLYCISSPLSEEDSAWSSPVMLPVQFDKSHAWHQDLIVNDEGNLEMIINIINPGESNNSTDLYYVEVKGDLSEATDPIMILSRGENETDFDYRSIYRSSIVKIGDVYYLYYSCIDKDWHRYMSLMRGHSLFDLEGLPEEEDLVINELMQSNIDCVLDDLNEFPDSWVEIYNPNSVKVDLGSYKISNAATPESGYQLPAGDFIGPCSYKLIYCDKIGEGFHTDFRLDSDKEKIYLFKNDEVVDSITDIPAQPSPNIAYGRLSDGSEEWGYRLHPTPGEANTGGITRRVLGNPVFSIPGRVGSEAITLELSIPEDSPEGTMLKYTLDGSEPTIDSPDYELPLQISETTVVSAKLFNDNAVSRRATVHSYIFHPREMTLPIVSIAMDEDYLYSDQTGIFSSSIFSDGKENYTHDWRRPVNFEFFTGQNKQAEINQLCETSLNGSSTSRSLMIKSMVFYADKRFGTNRFDYEFFPDQKPGVDEFKSIEASNAGNDAYGIYMRDALSQRMMGEYADLDWQAWQPAVVYVNGRYHGMLNLRERANEDNIYSNYEGLEKIDVIENWNEVHEGSIDNFLIFKNLYSDDKTEFEKLKKLMDVNEFANYFILNMFYANYNYPGNNVVLWRPISDNGIWRWIAKDMDETLGIYSLPYDFDFLTWLHTPDLYPDYTWGNKPESTLLFRRLLEKHEFKKIFIDKCLVYMGDFLTDDNTVNKMNQMYEIIKAELPSHLKKNTPSNTLPYDFHRQEAINFIRNRYEIIHDQIAGWFGVEGVTPVIIKDNRHLVESISVQKIQLRTGRFDGKYFVGRPMHIKALGEPASEFSGWKVDIYDENGLTSSNVYMDSEFAFVVPEAFQIKIYPVVMNDVAATEDIEDTIIGYYNLSGLKIGKDNLTPGIYIRKSAGGSVLKIMVK